MKLNLESMLYILICMTFLLYIVGYIAYFCKSRLVHQIEYILIKNIFLNIFKYSNLRLPKQYFSYLKYNIWRYYSLF